MPDGAWVLDADGRDFGRQLGLVGRPTDAELRLGERLPCPRRIRNVRHVWADFIKSRSEELRNRLVEHYLLLVRNTAKRIHSNLPDDVALGDLMSAGIFGLLDAIDAFDLDQAITFESYCVPWIRGAILDDLRKMDWGPRLVRSRSRPVDQSRKAPEMASGRTPTEDEAGRMWSETDSNKDVREIDLLEDPRQVNPLSAAQKHDLKDLITKGLSRAERLIVIYYYYNQMTMKEIGVTLDLSESRVSQMHSAILARLKAQLQHSGKTLAFQPTKDQECPAAATPKVKRKRETGHSSI
jgi:RNA polymerase sigma factor for flagellar operon FliA